MMIDVMISALACWGGGLGEKKKNSAGGSTHLPGLGVGVVVGCSLEQLEFFSPMDGRPSAVYPELGVNVSGVSPQGAQGHR